ncbi:MAG: AI-2E family transporter [Rhodocyclales bacterium GWA2_65_20]|nr:MAG: AI-2E family transporter [Rhodocyclales bacterium GWA2_65_20]
MQRPNDDRVLTFIALAMLVGGCALVLWPFLTALVWAAILASTSWPGFLWLERVVGHQRTVAALLMTLLVTVVLLGPVVAVAVVMADDLAELGRAITAVFKDGLPDAPGWLVDLPLLGRSIYDYWQQFAHDGQRLMGELQKLAKPAQEVALAAGRIVGQGVIDIAVSVFLAFFFFIHGEALAQRLGVALGRLTGDRAHPLLGIARGTVSGVIYGILGTGLAQGVLAAIGFAVAGVPGAVLLGVGTFFLSVVPVGPPLIWGGAAIWLFQQGEPGWAAFVVAWGFFVVSMVDNLIKPFIISRGAQLPFAIVFLGVLGGVLAFGVIGAFLGPALLAVGYRLTLEWTARDDAETADTA